MTYPPVPQNPQGAMLLHPNRIQMGTYPADSQLPIDFQSGDTRQRNTA